MTEILHERHWSLPRAGGPRYKQVFMSLWQAERGGSKLIGEMKSVQHTISVMSVRNTFLKAPRRGLGQINSAIILN